MHYYSTWKPGWNLQILYKTVSSSAIWQLRVRRVRIATATVISVPLNNVARGQCEALNFPIKTEAF